MTPLRAQKLRQLLEEAHATFMSSGEVRSDALEPALNFTHPIDQEFAAFICSCLAYGRVQHILASAHAILDRLGPHPVKMLTQSSTQDIACLCRGWRHRFNSSNDMALLLIFLKQVYTSSKTLEDFLKVETHQTAYDLLEHLHQEVSKSVRQRSKHLATPGSSFWYLIPKPSTGSACKRLNLFLRWMVRRSEADLGLWTRFSKERLIIPLDTHLLRQARALKFTRSLSANWKTALQVTEQLRCLDPDDPTRYDFALCHLGIHGRYLNRTSLKKPVEKRARDL